MLYIHNMGPVQSFKSSYDNNISKRKKPKRKPFGASHHSTVSGAIPEKELTDHLRAQIIAQSQKEKKAFKTKLIAVCALLASLLIIGLFLYF